MAGDERDAQERRPEDIEGVPAERTSREGVDAANGSDSSPISESTAVEGEAPAEPIEPAGHEPNKWEQRASRWALTWPPAEDGTPVSEPLGTEWLLSELEETGAIELPTLPEDAAESAPAEGLEPAVSAKPVLSAEPVLHPVPAEPVAPAAEPEPATEILSVPLPAGESDAVSAPPTAPAPPVAEPEPVTPVSSVVEPESVAPVSSAAEPEPVAPVSSAAELPAAEANSEGFATSIPIIRAEGDTAPFQRSDRVVAGPVSETPEGETPAPSGGSPLFSTSVEDGAPATFETPLARKVAAEQVADSETFAGAIPVVGSPAPAEPAVTEPAPAEPAPTESAPAEPAATEPALTEPVPTDPAPVEPATAEPVHVEAVPVEAEPTPEPEVVPVEHAPVPEPAEPAPTEPEPALAEPESVEPEPAPGEPGTHLESWERPAPETDPDEIIVEAEHIEEILHAPHSDLELPDDPETSRPLSGRLPVLSEQATPRNARDLDPTAEAPAAAQPNLAETGAPFSWALTPNDRLDPRVHAESAEPLPAEEATETAGLTRPEALTTETVAVDMSEYLGDAPTDSAASAAAGLIAGNLAAGAAGAAGLAGMADASPLSGPINIVPPGANPANPADPADPAEPSVLDLVNRVRESHTPDPDLPPAAVEIPPITAEIPFITTTGIVDLDAIVAAAESPATPESPAAAADPGETVAFTNRELADAIGVPVPPAPPVPPVRGPGSGSGATPPPPRGRKRPGWFFPLIAVAAIAALIGLYFLSNTIASSLKSPAEPAPSASAEVTPSTEPEPPATGPLPAGTHAWDELRGGECLAPFSDGWAREFTVVDCATEHNGQFVSSVVIDEAPDAVFPGEAALAARSALACSAPTVLNREAAAAFPDLLIQATYPITAEQWAAGQRSYDCFISRPDGAPLTGSLAPVQ
ncbi:hypothetical protein [Mycetocola spongiae]|uniref:hypothetical protein n=1 Tax=Mycetocola spongiae TaxID=2859226 RepID=UPI001CF3EFDF|nr:hypothetical protein [Mycetocola spongiae]UCR88368.1 hypothetical protein KXZ72_10355 [Mycetocola spongiae]